MVSKVTQEKVEPMKRGVYITDYTTGESKKVETTTSPSGKTTTKTSYTTSPASSGGRRRVSQLPPQTPKERLEIEKNVATFQGRESKSIQIIKARAEPQTSETITQEVIPPRRREDEITLYRGEISKKEERQARRKPPLGSYQVSLNVKGSTEVSPNETSPELRLQLESLSQAERMLNYKSGESNASISKMNPQRYLGKIVETGVKISQQEIGYKIAPSYLSGRYNPLKPDVTFRQFSQGFSVVAGEVGGAVAISSKTSFNKNVIKNRYQMGKSVGRFSGEVVGVLIPKNVGQAVVTGASIGLLPFAPPVIQAGTSGAFGVLGIKGALNKSLTPPERVASGIVGVLGVGGTGVILYPYVKGGVSFFNPKRLSIQQEAVKFGEVKGTAKFIKGYESSIGIDNIKTNFDIGIIPESIKPIKIKGASAGSGALLKGGFGFSPSEQVIAFAGQELRLTTSQANIKILKGIIATNKKVNPLGFFFSPSEPITGVPQTRISRLGLSKGLFQFTRTSELDYSFLPSGGQPKILVTTPTRIRGIVKVAPKGSSELELTAFSNLKVVGERRPTIIKGQRVDVYEVKITKASTTKEFNSGKFNKGDIFKESSIKTYKTPISTTLKLSVTSRKSLSNQTSFISNNSFNYSNSRISILPLRISRGLGFGQRGSYGKQPPLYSSRYSPITSSQINRPFHNFASSSTSPATTKVNNLFARGYKKNKITLFSYGVSIKRFGKFRSIATGLTEKQAFQIGASKVGGTLGATFKVTGGKTNLPTPTGFYRKGSSFIEKTKYRLSTRGEKKEIQFAKAMKLN